MYFLLVNLLYFALLALAFGVCFALLIRKGKAGRSLMFASIVPAFGLAWYVFEASYGKYAIADQCGKATMVTDALPARVEGYLNRNGCGDCGASLVETGFDFIEFRVGNEWTNQIRTYYGITADGMYRSEIVRLSKTKRLMALFAIEARLLSND